MKTKKLKKKRYFGVTKVSMRKDKLCWFSKQSKHGFSLGLALSKRTIWLTNLHFASEKELKAALKASVVFVYLKKAK